MTNDPALAALAEMLKAKQSAITHAPVHVAATPPQLPAFGMPGQTAGNSLPSMASYMKPYQTPPIAPPSASMPQPAPGNTAPQGGPSPMADPSVPPMPAPIQIGAAPGAGTDPSSLPMLAALLQRLKNPQGAALPEQMAMGQYPGMG